MAKIATREAYGKTIAELVAENENIVVLDADLSGSTKSGNAKKVAPERFFNIGIAEGNMMGIAAGLAASGKIVFASSFAMFATGRAWEQIRNSIAYPLMNVKICASHAGLTVGEDGATHQVVEDISIMRSIPNMKVYVPADAKEASQIVRFVAQIDGPCYVRLGRSAVDEIHDDSYQFVYDKGEVIKKGNRVALIACGIEVSECLKAYETLKAEGIEVTVINMPCIKPIDKDLIIKTARSHDVIITCEEASIIGGLGSAVAEVCCKYAPCKVIPIGVQDTFGESGTPAELLAKYELDADAIVKKVKKVIA